LMGGQIGTYNNATISGSTFWFELPVKLPQSETTLVDTSARF